MPRILQDIPLRAEAISAHSLDDTTLLSLKKPVLEMSGSCVHMLEWEAFIHRFFIYKSLSSLTGDAASYLLDCLSKEVYEILLSSHGEGVSSKSEKVLAENSKRLEVRKRMYFLR